MIYNCCDCMKNERMKMTCLVLFSVLQLLLTVCFEDTYLSSFYIKCNFFQNVYKDVLYDITVWKIRLLESILVHVLLLGAVLLFCLWLHHNCATLSDVL
jgi:hypothetical protein